MSESKGYQPKGEPADLSKITPPQRPSPIAPSSTAAGQQYSIYDWFRELYHHQEKLSQRLEALEDENTLLKRRVAELEEWRDGLDLPDQPQDGPARPILPPYEG